MRRKFFLKNLILFLIPLLIPTVVLGSLSIFITQRYVQGEMNKNNIQLINQMDRNMEMIFNEMDSLAVSFGSREVIYRIEEMLRTQTVTLENLRLMQATQNYIDAPANARPYIDSIYVYIRNPHQQFLASGTGLTKLGDYHDTSWMDSFRVNQDSSGIWMEERLIRRYQFEGPIRVTTIYKPLLSTVSNKPMGVIVLNINTTYMEKLLQTYETYPDQHLFVLDEQDRMIFRSKRVAELGDALELGQIARSAASFKINWAGERYHGFQLPSERYEGWRYLSIAPGEALNQIPFRLSRFTVFFVLLSFLLGLALTYYLTRRSLNHIRRMISIIKSAEKGLPLPRLTPKHGEDEYNYIIQTMTRKFIEQNYLNVQLSEKKYKLQAAELMALQSQMNPHFLFNTLETINWKVIGLTQRPNEVNTMLENLSDLLRYSLDTPDRIVTLEKEISNTQNYIDIQKIRYEDQFDVIWAYDSEEVKKYSIVKLVLQPLIENSLYHGIKEKTDKGLIKIKIESYSAFVRIAVIDNGIGIRKEVLQQVRERMNQDMETTDHIGLMNTNKRIKLTYNLEEGIRIQSKPGLGTVVSLRIPI